MPYIRVLPDHLVNQIAAGEVVERPASALKELVENAIDAGARQIRVTLRDGGKSLISVQDDGCGMGRDDIPLALTRHATSKLNDDDLSKIGTLGFRGEALPSIASVSSLSLTSRVKGEDTAWHVMVDQGRMNGPTPISNPEGTTIEVRDLFSATPARLKFLKTDATEYAACKDVLIRLALSYPAVGFTLHHNGQAVFSFSPCTEADPMATRLRDALGAEFHDNTVALLAEDRSFRITGRVGLPTFNRGQANHQFFFVNGRPVKDRVLLGAFRAAYGDLIPHDRHGVGVLFFDLDPAEVDINVHPAKAEVRFRDGQRVRGLLIGAIRHRLVEVRGTAQSLTDSLVDRLVANDTPRFSTPSSQRPPTQFNDTAFSAYRPLFPATPAARVEQPSQNENDGEPAAHPLGAARAQIHGTYIVAQTTDGMVLIDQHAAHERLTYERYKNQMEMTGIPAQRLLTPEIVTLDDARSALLLEHAEELNGYGLEIEPFGNGALLVRALPAELAERLDIPKLVEELADEVLEKGTSTGLQDRLLAFLAGRACRFSVRAGRILNADEMNALLRQIETTPHATQCNHGRPTYISLSLKDIEKLFERR